MKWNQMQSSSNSSEISLSALVFGMDFQVDTMVGAFGEVLFQRLA